MKNNFLVGIDIGSEKICTVIGQVNSEDGREELEVIGSGVTESTGIKKGVIVDMNSTVEDIRKSVREAELTAGVEVESAYVSISGSNIETRTGKGSVTITGRNSEITQEDVDRVITHGSGMLLPQDRDIIHVLTQEFVVDSQEGIQSPKGMIGTNLDAYVVVVTTNKASIKNLLICLRKAKIDVNRSPILSHIATAEAVLTKDEKELGVALIDIGAGTTDVSVFEKGALSYARTLPVGGMNFTNDLAIGIRTPIDVAEKIKRRYGCGLDPELQNQTVEIPSVGGKKQRHINVSLLSDILRPRAEEIFELIAESLESNGLVNRINAGIVLTGGSSVLDGLVEIGDDIFSAPIRIGKPSGVGGLIDKVGSPDYSTAVGLLKFAFADMKSKGIISKQPGGVLNKLKVWLGM